MKEIESIKSHKSNVEVFFDNGDNVSVTFDGDNDLFTREEYAEILADEYGIKNKDDQDMIMEAIEANIYFFFK